MTALTTAEDLATHLGAEVDTAQAEQALDLAEAVVLTEYGSDTAPTADRPRQLLRRVVLAAAARWLRNPEQLSAETAGPYTNNRTSVDLTDYERGLVRAARAGGATTSGITSVALLTPADVATTT